MTERNINTIVHEAHHNHLSHQWRPITVVAYMDGTTCIFWWPSRHKDAQEAEEAARACYLARDLPF